jgi:hypothetical protein
MRPDAVIIVSLTWEQVQRICDILAEVGNAELIKPFENATYLTKMQEDRRDAYNRGQTDVRDL